MKLSILDQAPIASNETPQQALQNALLLAQHGEALGYTRYWIAEHHDLAGLACSAPEIMLSYIGAQTKTIRLGTGALLLPHYKPYKVAELFHMLATLLPNRIDVGIGRAPGGSSEAMIALSGNFIQNVGRFPQLVEELLQFLQDDFQPENAHAKLSAAPVPAIAPVPWLLGTGQKSAVLAAQHGLPFTFGHFMSSEDGVAVIQQYRDTFTPSTFAKTSYVIVTASVICAETTEQAEHIAQSFLIWSLQLDKGSANGIPSIEEAHNYELNEADVETLQTMKKRAIIGNPAQVKEQLHAIQRMYGADEIMINTIAYSLHDRLQSYTLIANEMKFID
ncbi:LLM class flavin-dependent oxidoreductase [Caryophanon latum]|uniref:Luciferase n=1 Tax=Caryophanon latum TaxID=33977 RepID=A0A1C0YQ43_9BACL|nr:LLM class flavin-dependent oxidoreductase [Caryophanon latum]OCS89275.1 luciferase [Caryophanon latum]